MTVHQHNLKRTADKHAKELRSKGLTVTVSKNNDTKGYAVYSYRK